MEKLGEFVVNISGSLTKLILGEASDSHHSKLFD